MKSGGLASPKPPDDGGQEEHGDEENERESRGRIQGQDGRGGAEGRQVTDEVNGALWRISNPDHRREASQVLSRAHVLPGLPKAGINPG